MNLWLLILIVMSILILLFIFIPIRYEAGFAYHDSLSLYAAIKQRLIFSIAIERINNKYLFSLRLINIPLPLPRSSKKSKNKKRKPKQGSTSPKAILRNFIRNKTYQPLWKFVSRLLNDFKPKQLQIKCQYGFYEPHHTAWINMLLLLIPSDSPNYQIQMEPVWNDEKLNVEGFVKGSITLAGIAWHTIRFVFSPSFWKFLRDLSRDRKRIKVKTKAAILHQG